MLYFFIFTYLFAYFSVILQPNETVIVSPPPERPPSHLCLSIVTCLFCFWPLGLAALCVSCSVRTTYMYCFFFYSFSRHERNNMILTYYKADRKDPLFKQRGKSPELMFIFPLFRSFCGRTQGRTCLK